MFSKDLDFNPEVVGNQHEKKFLSKKVKFHIRLSIFNIYFEFHCLLSIVKRSRCIGISIAQI